MGGGMGEMTERDKFEMQITFYGRLSKAAAEQFNVDLEKLLNTYRGVVVAPSYPDDRPYVFRPDGITSDDDAAINRLTRYRRIRRDRERGPQAAKKKAKQRAAKRGGK